MNLSALYPQNKGLRGWKCNNSVERFYEVGCIDVRVSVKRCVPFHSIRVYVRKTSM